MTDVQFSILLDLLQQAVDRQIEAIERGLPESFKESRMTFGRVVNQAPLLDGFRRLSRDLDVYQSQLNGESSK